MKESLDNPNNPKNNQSRREFLKGVVGVAATPSLLATPVYGHHTESQSREIVPEPLEWEGIVPNDVHFK